MIFNRNCTGTPQSSIKVPQKLQYPALWHFIREIIIKPPLRWHKTSMFMISSPKDASNEKPKILSILTPTPHGTILKLLFLSFNKLYAYHCQSLWHGLIRHKRFFKSAEKLNFERRTSPYRTWPPIVASTKKGHSVKQNESTTKEYFEPGWKWPRGCREEDF